MFSVSSIYVIDTQRQHIKIIGIFPPSSTDLSIATYYTHHRVHLHRIEIALYPLCQYCNTQVSNSKFLHAEGRAYPNSIGKQPATFSIGYKYISSNNIENPASKVMRVYMCTTVPKLELTTTLFWLI